MAIAGGTVALIVLTASFALAILVLVLWTRQRPPSQDPTPRLAHDPESNQFPSSSSTSLQDQDDDPPRQRIARPIRKPRSRVPTGSTSATKSSLRGSIRRAWESLGLPHRTLVGDGHPVASSSAAATHQLPYDGPARRCDEPLSPVTERTEASSSTREPDFGWKR